MAALSREVALPVLAFALLASAGSAGVPSTAAVPAVNRLAPSLAANVSLADKPLPAAVSKADVAIAAVQSMEVAADKPEPVAAGNADFALPPVQSMELASATTQSIVVGKPDTVTTGASVTAALVEPAPAAHEPESKPSVVAALTSPSEILPQETLPAQAAQTSTEPAAASSNDAKPSVDSVEILDECYVVDACVDRYLWALYQRTPKEDTVKAPVQREVTVKRKGKTVTVTRTVTQLVDEDFAWKDPKAAETAGMAITDYVIGGMDRDFKLRLFHLLNAAEQAGLSPGITSAFRDDYRQSIASGLKASNDRSYHGGSFRGGYGHGLAADIVSVKGATRAERLNSSQALWNWVDARGKTFGIGRPYHDRDPPHVGPIDGTEYVSKHAGGRARHARAPSKPVARGGGNGASKPVRTARS
jgi:hypothetical protein